MDNELTLFPYQHEGAQWLVTHDPRTKFKLLADPMGVGKTCQVIEALNRSPGINAVLVLCPAIARAHWFGEYAKFAARAVSLCVRTYETAFSKIIAGQGRRETDRNLLRPWDLLVLDECHYLCNPQAQRTRTAYLHVAPYAARVWCLSGTPARNHNGDMYTFAKAAGIYAGKYSQFIQRYCIVQQTDYGERIIGSKNTAELRALIRPFILRRRKEDVLPQLPPIQFCLYRVDPGPVDIKRYFPDIYLGRIRMESMLADVQKEDDAIEKLYGVLGETDDFVNALKALQTRTQASRRWHELQKVPAVAELVKAELNGGAYDKIVLFCWHQNAIEELRHKLQKFNPVVIWGQSAQWARAKAERRFNQDPDCHVLLGNIQAAGVAINLSVAHEVGFVGSSFVPADNAQAAMRVHRLPQAHPVRVRFFCLAGSTDDRVQRILNRKTRDLTELLGDNMQDPFGGMP